MNILLVDTSQERHVVCVFKGDEKFCKISDKKFRGHNREVMLNIDNVLAKASITLDKIVYFAAVAGPGSFTGIRIGVSIINSFLLAKNKKGILLNSLEVMKSKSEKNGLYLIDARHNNYYGALYKSGQLKELREFTKDEIDKLDVKKILYNDEKISIQNYYDIIIEKIKKKELLDEIRPMYLKKSQAEREYGNKKQRS